MHLPIIINSEGKKLSKRDENYSSINDYKERGFLPQAILNFLLLLGWNPKNKKEFFSKEEMIKIFNLDYFSKSPSKFDEEKLKWFNNHYVRKMEDSDYLVFINEFLNNKKFYEFSDSKQKEILLLFKEQIHEGIEINELVKIFTEKYHPKKYSITEYNIALTLKKKLNSIESKSYSNTIKKVLTEIKNELNLNGRDFFFPLRKLITNLDHGPNIDKVFLILGKKEIEERINIYLSLWKK